jgi:uncharacterized membrane protein YebE (DUF533 family)
MAQQILKLFVCVALVISMAGSAFAQGSLSDDQKKSLSGPRKQLATIIFGGLGGAILGLSTLSFYGRPQDKLSNIAIGAAVGVIAGTAFVTYKAATNPSELYGDRSQLEHELALAQAAKNGESSALGAKLTFEF